MFWILLKLPVVAVMVGYLAFFSFSLSTLMAFLFLLSLSHVILSFSFSSLFILSPHLVSSSSLSLSLSISISLALCHSLSHFFQSCLQTGTILPETARQSCWEIIRGWTTQPRHIWTQLMVSKKDWLERKKEEKMKWGFEIDYRQKFAWTEYFKPKCISFNISHRAHFRWFTL